MSGLERSCRARNISEHQRAAPRYACQVVRPQHRCRSPPVNVSRIASCTPQQVFRVPLAPGQSLAKGVSRVLGRLLACGVLRTGLRRPAASCTWRHARRQAVFCLLRLMHSCVGSRARLGGTLRAASRASPDRVSRTSERRTARGVSRVLAASRTPPGAHLGRPCSAYRPPDSVPLATRSSWCIPIGASGAASPPHPHSALPASCVRRPAPRPCRPPSYILACPR